MRPITPFTARPVQGLAGRSLAGPQLSGLSMQKIADVTKILLDDPRKIISSVEFSSNLWDPVGIVNPLVGSTSAPNPYVEAAMQKMRPSLTVRFANGIIDPLVLQPWGAPTPGVGEQFKETAVKTGLTITGVVGAIGLAWLAVWASRGGR